MNNYKIIGTYLGVEDHGFTGLKLTLEGYPLLYEYGFYCINAEQLGIAVRRILEVVGVMSWEELKGRYVRLEGESRLSNKHPKLGNILRDVWFDIDKEIKD